MSPRMSKPFWVRSSPKVKVKSPVRNSGQPGTIPDYPKDLSQLRSRLLSTPLVHEFVRLEMIGTILFMQ